MIRLLHFYALAFCFLCHPPSAFCTKEATLLLDLTNNKTLYAYRANEPHAPASLTKIMTAFLTFDAMEKGHLDWNTRVRVPHAATRVGPSKIGYKAGEHVSLRDLIYAMLVCSANDAAITLAHHLAGSEAAFVQQMNAKAKKIGMNRTRFMNASGWPHKKQTTTASDLAKLSKAVLEDHPRHYFLFSVPSYHYKDRHFMNTNKFLGQNNGVDGIKTGFVNASRFNIIVSRVFGGNRFLAIVLGEATKEARNKKVTKLLNIHPRNNHHKPPLKESSGCLIPESGTWAIQLGAFQTREQAAAFMTSLQKDLAQDMPFLKSFTIIHHKNLFKPLVGPYPHADEAIEGCHALKRHHIDCFVVGNPIK